MSEQLLISVIIPIYNGSEYIQKCLDSLKDSYYKNFEIIVVDDNSKDNSCDIVKKNKITLYEMENHSGPAAARNCGAVNAKGEIILFLDSDIVIRPDTISKIASIFSEDTDLSAVFGSYDDDPYEKDFLSQYKNLLHHFVHQNSNSEANTFWAGCGAIKKSAFEDVGGFDEKKYRNSSIEDIELGYRLRVKGYKIFLDKEIQVKHLKSWNFMNWLKVEILNRAIPWSKLIIETGVIPFDLNLKISDRFSAVVSWAILLLIAILCYSVLTGEVLIFSKTAVLILFIFCIFAFIFFNKKFYYFLLKKRGLKFSIYISPYHFLFYIYSSASFVIVYVKYKILSLYYSNS